MTSKGKAVVIDGNSLLYRAFFAMPHFSTLENQPTNAVYGLCLMLLRLIQEEKPDCLFVAFDAPVKTFRHEEYTEYKAQRKPTPDDLKSQTQLARDAVEAFGIPRLEVEGFEADDVVGTFARMAEADGYDVIIVTGDLDALQLVDDKVHVMTTVKGVSETVVYDEEAVMERFALRPDQLPDYKGLKGDTSDNIPGVPGVGDKTAKKLVSEFGSLENLLDGIEKVPSAKTRQLLSEHSEQAILSKRLGTIVTDVPLDLKVSDCRFKTPDYNALREFFKRLEFRSLLKKLPGESPQGTLFATETPKTASPFPNGVILTEKAEIRRLLEECRSSGMVAIRIHTDSNRGMKAALLGIAFCADEERPVYVGFEQNSGICIADLREILESANISKAGHDLKFELEVLRRADIRLAGELFDSMLAGYLLNPTRGNHDLSEVAFDYGDLSLPEASDRLSKIDQVCAEACAIRRLIVVLKEKLQAEKLTALMDEIEMPLVPILAEMEMTGIAVDADWLRSLSAKLGTRIASAEQEIYALAGCEFNIGSPKQLQVILFEKLGLPSTKKTKTGYSTDAETLAGLVSAHPVIGKVLEYRELAKLKSTYADSLPGLIDPETGRVHTTLNQAVTATGRLSSSDPNLQNIPIRSEIGREIRRAFVASSGSVLLSADYSQIELRILAHESADPALMNAFMNDEDLHTKTAVSVFGVAASLVTPEMRRQAKTVNFAVIYGMSDYGLSRDLNIPVGVAKSYIESYFKEYPGVKEYAAAVLSEARVRGYVQSLCGRRRYMPELNSPNRNLREFAERAAVNMPIQGSAADIVKIAMIRVNRGIADAKLKARMLLQVHDELVFDVPESELDALIPIVRTSMEEAYSLRVPLKVEMKVGKDWCTALPVSAEDDADASL
jgi:DNA polymerase-1